MWLRSSEKASHELKLTFKIILSSTQQLMSVTDDIDFVAGNNSDLTVGQFTWPTRRLQNNLFREQHGTVQRVIEAICVSQTMN